MHTLKVAPDTAIHFNGDFAGDVIISSPIEKVTIPMEQLDVLFAERIRRQLIAKIEQMSDQEIIDHVCSL